MTSDVLVLSTSYEPLGRTDWQRAMVLWAAGKVEILVEQDGNPIHGATQEYARPSVIRFKEGVRRRHIRKVKFARRFVHQRDGGKCQLCGQAVPVHKSTYDHVIPRSRGGKTAWDNIVTACKPCNSKKADRTPEEAGIRLLSKPVRPDHLLVPIDPSLAGTDLPASWRPFLYHLKADG